MISGAPPNRPLKLRDEADPYSLELGMVSKGDIVKILEVRCSTACIGILLQNLKEAQQCETKTGIYLKDVTRRSNGHLCPRSPICGALEWI